ncbi:MAG: LamG domain-containing protein, partial [Lachnospiraceae bacterium]|nr:LamG domain-containing protein [Lachnospiraceae bacterium]
MGSTKKVLAAVEIPKPVLYYDFEGSGKTAVDSVSGLEAKLNGRASVKSPEGWDSKAVYLINNGYVELPKGFFDKRDTMTISMDVYSMMGSENFFTLAIGQDTDKYFFLRTRSSQIRTAITKASYSAEYDLAATGIFDNKWVNVTMVFENNKMSLYIDGILADVKDNVATKISDLGSDLTAYLGKSFYSGDVGFKGYIDNFTVYEEALTAM